MELTDKLALDLVREDYDEGVWEALEQDIDDGFVKHDITAYHSTYLNKESGEIFVVNYQCSYNHGLDDYNIYWYKAKKKEITTVQYVPLDN